MKVLVTGGAGLIGSFLIDRLLNEGKEVICIDNFITSSEANIKRFSKFSNFKLFKHDISKDLPKALENKSFRINEIYHLACPTGVPNLPLLSLEMLHTSSLGTENILKIAKAHNSSFIFTSTSEVYGNPLEFPQKETYAGNVNPVGPRSPYEEGKRFAECLIMSYVKKYSLNAKIVRLFNVYGPKKYEDTRVIAKFINQAKKNKPITVEGQGNQMRTFCYVEDIVEALILINRKGQKGEIYNAGSNRLISILDLANIIKSVTNSKSNIELIDRPSHDHQSRLPDLKKVKKLGWKQKIDLEEGLKKIIMYKAG